MRKLKKSLTEVQKHRTDEVDKEPVEEEATKAIEKHDELCHDVAQYLDTLERQQQKAKKFFDDVNDIKDWAPKVEEKIKQSEPKSKEPQDLKQELKRLDVSNLYINNSRCLFVTVFTT